MKNAAATGAPPDPYKLVLPKGLIAPYASNEAIKPLGSMGTPAAAARAACEGGSADHHGCAAVKKKKERQKKSNGLLLTT